MYLNTYAPVFLCRLACIAYSPFGCGAYSRITRESTNFHLRNLIEKMFFFFFFFYLSIEGSGYLKILITTMIRSMMKSRSETEPLIILI
jgi:hypothetical protein